MYVVDQPGLFVYKKQGRLIYIDKKKAGTLMKYLNKKIWITRRKVYTH